MEKKLVKPIISASFIEPFVEEEDGRHQKSLVNEVNA